MRKYRGLRSRSRSLSLAHRLKYSGALPYLRSRSLSLAHRLKCSCAPRNPRRCEGAFTDQGLDSSLRGMQHQSGPEAAGVLRALAPHAASCAEELSASAACASLAEQRPGPRVSGHRREILAAAGGAISAFCDLLTL